MNMHTYTHIHMYRDAHIHKCIYALIYIHTYTHIHKTIIMYTYVDVHVHLYMHLHTYINDNVHMYRHYMYWRTHTYVMCALPHTGCAHIWTCDIFIHKHTDVFICTYMHTQIYISKKIYVHKFIHIHILAYIHTPTYRSTHIYIHT